jgi:hypothetical protein
MRFLVSFALALIVTTSAACAADKPDVSTFLTDWVAAVESHDAAKVVALYDNDAIFFSTFAVAPMKTQAERLAYYKKVVAEPDIKIDIVESHPHVFGDVAINSGLYTFHYTQDGEPVTIPARFSFAYMLKGDKWMIIDHHSSKMPGKGEK